MSQPDRMVQSPAPGQLQPVAPTLRQGAPHDPRGLGGLVALADGAEQPLPLQAVTVRAAIAGDCCRTVIEQRFHNPLDVAMEAIHIFPLPEGGAVVEMTLRAGEVTVRAECREREEAQRVFETARAAGQRAGLLTQERADVHALRVTNLPPRTEVGVRIVVVERLESVDGRLRWRFPTVIAPRYLPGEPIGHAGPGVLPDTDHVPDASRLQPPLRMAGGTMLDLEVEIAGPVTVLESSLHAVRVELGSGASVAPGAVAASATAEIGAPSAGHPDGPRVRIAPSGQATLDRDFVLAFATAAPEAATARAWTDGAYTLVFVEPPADVIPTALPRDAVFVIDVSGSMSGRKIEAARKALRGALHGLTAGDRFMLIAFNQGMAALHDGFVDYTQHSLDEADRWIAGLRADGGTEMLPPVQAALAGETPEGRLRTVLFVTDGQAWNEAELVAAIAHRRGEARFFTLGIDTAVNSALLRRMARIGGGTCELLAPSDDIEAAVAKLEARFGSPLAVDVRVEGGVPASDAPLTLFAGRPASSLLEGAPSAVRVTGRMPAGEIAWDLAPARTRFPLGALWARDRVAALEDRMTLRPHEAEALRPEILRIALAHAIASRYTAFVAVDTSVTTTGERVEVVQPVELPLGWDPAFLPAAQTSPQILGAAAARPVLYAATSAPGMIGGVRARFAKASGRRPETVLMSPDADAFTDFGDSTGAMPHSPAPAQAASAADPVAETLAQRQMADGSFGGDMARTAAALVALVLAGHTRRAGLRRRVVAKAATWLALQAGDPLADLALAVLARAEAGEDPRRIAADLEDQIGGLGTAGEEGALMQFALREGGG